MERTSIGKVLVADDERAIADTLAAILNRSGYETRAVYSGESAIEVASCFRPNMLITDVVMPGTVDVAAHRGLCSLMQDSKKDARRECTGHLRSTTLAAEPLHHPSAKFVASD
jgi:CheY-like chemotaxis protein